MALFKKYPGKAGIPKQKLRGSKDRMGTEEEDARESAIMRLLKAGCLPHFGSFAFRSAFFAHCLDTKVLQALLRAQLAAPLWQRRVAGVACARAQPAQVSLQNLGVLEAEGLGAAHGCLSALLFEAHALEAPDYALSSEELQLLEQSNYSLAYLPPKVRSKLASLLLPQSTWREPPAEKALSYPRAGDEAGLWGAGVSNLDVGTGFCCWTCGYCRMSGRTHLPGGFRWRTAWCPRWRPEMWLRTLAMREQGEAINVRNGMQRPSMHIHVCAAVRAVAGEPRFLPF
ncbi:unnamed protein product [Effrenium voratum]|nr:unnamed protein product [Effrenium voratum]